MLHQETSSVSPDIFDTERMVRVLWSSRWFLIFASTLLALGGGVFAITAIEWYQADVVMAQADSRGGSSSLSQLGELASLARINIGAVGGGDSQATLAALRSRDLSRDSGALQRDDYVSLSGGTTRKADRRKIYVVRADGSVMVQRGGLLRRNHDVGVQPGDTIVVPLDTERMPRLSFWQAVTQIVYNLAVSVAEIKLLILSVVNAVSVYCAYA